MQTSIAIITFIGTLIPLLTFWLGHRRAYQQQRSELQSKRWSEILECLRILEDQSEPDAIKVACKQRLRDLAYHPALPATLPAPEGVTVPDTISPLGPAPTTEAVHYTVRPSWEQLSPRQRGLIRSVIIIRAILFAGAAALLAVLVQYLAQQFGGPFNFAR